MLTKADVEWIKNNRKETTHNRTFPITLEGEVKVGEHPVTREPIVEEVTEEVDALVTEITSAFKMDVSVVAGVEVEKGDLWVVIDLSEFETLTPSAIRRIKYFDDDFRVLAADREGLGEHNRLTVVARLIS